ncbi:hypothetical protein H4R35_007585 [Dimargaris xerosporica]|nr:hypothetical protein H4R35_007585 [Dimargaris xerosporica]
MIRTNQDMMIPLQEFGSSDSDDSSSHDETVVETLSDHATLMVHCLERSSSHRREKYFYHAVTPRAPLRPRSGAATPGITTACARGCGSLPVHEFYHEVFGARATDGTASSTPTVVPEAVLSIQARRHSNSHQVTVWQAFTFREILFVAPPSYDLLSDSEFRTSLLAILELAEDHLGCSSVVMCLARSQPHSADLVRAFMYTGFEMVHPSVYGHSSKFVLVGYEL